MSLIYGLNKNTTRDNACWDFTFVLYRDLYCVGMHRRIQL